MDLPESWQLSRLADLGVWTGGGTPTTSRSEFWENGTIPWVSPKDMKRSSISDAEDSVTEEAIHSSSTNLIRSGSILLVTRSGILKHSLPVAVNTRPVTINQDLKALSTGEHLSSEYLYFAFRRYEREILHTCCKGGTTVQSVEFPRLLDFEIPIPPLAEQRRIVAKIEELFSEWDKGIETLKTAKAQLAAYRQAILKDAIEGKLVPTDSQWKNVRFKDLIGKISQGWSPKCELGRDPLPEEWAIVTTTAVQPMKYLDNQAKPLPNNLLPRPQIEIKQGDFLMTRKGPRKRAGVACLVRSTRPKIMVCDTVYRFRCHESVITPSYLEVALNAPQIVQAIDREKAGINESGVSLTHDKLGVILIPLPPITEQKRIVEEVERCLSITDEMESDIDTNLQKAEVLRQAILKKAFAGKLVPQDPSDEPASALLERIRAERSEKPPHSAISKPKPRGRKPRTATA